ncbi:UNVERIFIED_CONTAM: hypothetical protein Sradi_6437800 [Sesamum radiatum]|uniref:Uncharacterized protein n=1 Tax=Sesamum radiatum TaxID=300843 RepID=A0AAW2K3Q1_SESRA
MVEIAEKASEGSSSTGLSGQVRPGPDPEPISDTLSLVHRVGSLVDPGTDPLLGSDPANS